MKLKTLSCADKPLVKRYLALSRRELSAYTFENIFLWKPLYDIRWAISDGCLCIFFQDKLGSFMYLPPLGGRASLAAVRECFAHMDTSNRTSGGASRIENIEEKDVLLFSDAGYLVREKFPEYLCATRDIAGLKGNKFKSQRASFNHFTKNYQFTYGPIAPQDKSACLRLYRRWMRMRRQYEHDRLYAGMASDTLACLSFLFGRWRDFDLQARAVKVGGVIKAFTIGCRVSADIFCISHEITDLSIKGLSQFIFSTFARELAGYAYLNIMDDSGLENLKKTKMLYHPSRMIPAFIAQRAQ